MDLKEELRLHNENLNHLPYIIIANKMDDPESEKNLIKFKEEIHETIFEISAELNEGTPLILEYLYNHFFIETN